MPIPDFDREPHEYRFGGRLLPSVTQVLHGQRMLPDYRGLDPFYRERGSAVHDAVALRLLGRLDESSLDDVVAPFVERFDRFAAAWDLEPLVVEQPLCDPALCYAGTADLAARSERAGGVIVVDYKATTFEAGHVLQLAGGYLPLLELAADAGEIPLELDDLRSARLAVVTLSQKTPSPRWVTDDPLERLRAREIFRAALTCYGWRRRHPCSHFNRPPAGT